MRKCPLSHLAGFLVIGMMMFLYVSSNNGFNIADSYAFIAPIK